MEKTEEDGQPVAARKILGKLQANKESLHISRIPKKTKAAFIELAEQEFCGDYGMCLKWLIDDIPNVDTRMIIAKLEDHEVRLVTLDATMQTNSPQVIDEKAIKMLDGTEKKVKL